MAYNFSFADNCAYGAEDINRITSRLVTSGVADSFLDGVPYNMTDLNASGARLYTSGAVMETVNTLKVTADVTAETVQIFPGTAFFADGAVMEIEEGGHTLSFALGEKHYVYLKNDLKHANTCYPACTTTEPDGDFVPLAEILEDGRVRDVRTYAMGKLPGYQSNAMCVLKISDTAVRNKDKNDYQEERSYQIGNNSYRYLLCVQDESGGGAGPKVLSLYDFSTGSSLSCFGGFASLGDGKVDTSVMGHFRRQSDFYLCYDTNESLIAKEISLQDGVLTFSLLKSAPDYTETTFPFTLYLF